MAAVARYKAGSDWPTYLRGGVYTTEPPAPRPKQAINISRDVAYSDETCFQTGLDTIRIDPIVDDVPLRLRILNKGQDPEAIPHGMPAHQREAWRLTRTTSTGDAVPLVGLVHFCFCEGELVGMGGISLVVSVFTLAEGDTTYTETELVAKVGKVKVVKGKVQSHIEHEWEVASLLHVGNERCRHLLNFHQFVSCTSSSGAIFHLIMMDKLESSLPAYIRDRGEPVTPDFVGRIGAGVARGLIFMHAKNVVHCDLKPENILIDMNGNAVIADFGLSVNGPPSLNVATPCFAPLEVCVHQVQRSLNRFSNDEFSDPVLYDALQKYLRILSPYAMCATRPDSPDVWGYVTIVAHLVNGGRLAFEGVTQHECRADPLILAGGVLRFFQEVPGGIKQLSQLPLVKGSPMGELFKTGFAPPDQRIRLDECLAIATRMMEWSLPKTPEPSEASGLRQTQLGKYAPVMAAGTRGRDPHKRFSPPNAPKLPAAFAPPSPPSLFPRAGTTQQEQHLSPSALLEVSSHPPIKKENARPCHLPRKVKQERDASDSVPVAVMPGHMWGTTTGMADGVKGKEPQVADTTEPSGPGAPLAAPKPRLELYSMNAFDKLDSCPQLQGGNSIDVSCDEEDRVSPPPNKTLASFAGPSAPAFSSSAVPLGFLSREAPAKSHQDPSKLIPSKALVETLRPFRAKSSLRLWQTTQWNYDQLHESQKPQDPEMRRVLLREIGSGRWKCLIAGCDEVIVGVFRTAQSHLTQRHGDSVGSKRQSPKGTAILLESSGRGSSTRSHKD